MIRIAKGIQPEEVRYDARHVLFVEGRDSDSLDPLIVGELFDGMIRIEPLGASFSIKSAAEALHPFHPNYYFLVDRDHYDDDFINRCWNNFPDPGTHNLLTWKYREIENYFLEPDYLALSDFLVVSKEALARKIKQSCQERLYLDAVNHVIVSIREELKQNWIQKFKNPSDFKTREQAIGRLQSANEFQTFQNNVAARVDFEEVKRRFNDILNIMTGGVEFLEFGIGKWLQMIQGKRVLARVVHSGCFKVVDREGNLLQGQEKINQVVKNLLKKDTAKQPDDFQELKRLIKERLNPGGIKTAVDLDD
jgi:hypothetical protein